ncbi:MAG: CpaF family protein [Actinobacteria bacterium]|nr:CpaF family protein [Actinomycetota bacterium]NDH12589.1 CpaF family protein [Actinomycetota bacterium]TRZ83975.1 MAG: CpaF family protein [Streptomycetaceae bacterium]
MPTPLKKYETLQNLLDDPEIEEIWINAPERIFVAKNGKSALTNLIMTKESVTAFVEKALMWGGRRLDLSHPFVDARLPDGSRLHVAIPEITAEHWAVNIRKHLIRDKSLNDLSKYGVMSEEIAKYLTLQVRSGKNMLISGSTQAGKTTLLNALVGEIPKHDRVITIEEVFELKPNLPDLIAMQTRSMNLEGSGEISMRKLIKESLRMRPSRLIIGEIREAESLDLLIALNSGLPGMATIHANSAKDAIRKLQTLPLLAGENISHHFVTPLVARSIDLVIQIAIDSDGSRKVTEILQVTKRIEGEHIETDPIWTLANGAYFKGALQIS